MGLRNKRQRGNLPHLSQDLDHTFYIHTVTPYCLSPPKLPYRILGRGTVQGAKSASLLEKDQADRGRNARTCLGCLKGHPCLVQMRHGLDQDQINPPMNEVRNLLFECGRDVLG